MPKKTSRTVSLFRNGRSQAVRIPKEFEFDAQEAVFTLQEDGKTLTLEPVSRPDLGKLLDDWTLENRTEDEMTIPEIANLPLPEIDPFENHSE